MHLFFLFLPNVLAWSLLKMRFKISVILFWLNKDKKNLAARTPEMLPCVCLCPSPSVSPSPLRKTSYLSSSCCKSLFSFSLALKKKWGVSSSVLCKCVGDAVTWLWHSVTHSSGKKKTPQNSCWHFALFQTIHLNYTGVSPPPTLPCLYAATIWTVASGTPYLWAPAPCQDTVTR